MVMAAAIRTYLSEQLHQACEKAFGADCAPGDDIIIEKPKSKAHGDLSTPLAMGLAKSLHKPPPAIAKEIMAQFQWDERFIVPDPHLHYTVAGGFINFRISKKYLISVLEHIVTSPETFGKNQVGRPQRLLFEFVSANPT
ncbi:MAG: hypothetical protein GF350_14275, partial [Chitinivibrionales bacterium]|nr:hypothetical protein [Chitinivibrionales bacterium]